MAGMNSPQGRIAAGVALLAAAGVLSGCADLMKRSVVAPSWFQAKAVEVKGEGYPSLNNIPPQPPKATDKKQWDAEAVRLKELSATLDAQTPAEGSQPTGDDIRASAAQLRALAEQGQASQPASPPTGKKP